MVTTVVRTTGGADPAPPPALFRLAGHAVRWRLIQELALSDRQVRELTTLVREQQSLTSYHLGQLRQGGLVSVRRSSADARDAYYSLDLVACRDALVDAGASLHPGLRQSLPTSSPVDGTLAPRAGRSAVRVLFVCTGNSARSQMAQALLETAGGPAVTVQSAGVSPKEIHPGAVRVMRARGIDISGRRPKHVDELEGQTFDVVVTLCDRAREACADLARWGVARHWSMADPASEAASDDDAPFVRAADELTTRIAFLLPQISGEDP